VKRIYRVMGFLVLIVVACAEATAQQESYLSWTAARAVDVGKSMRRQVRAGSSLGFRGLHTERAISYKLRATWLTPEVIRATARHLQLRMRLSNEQTMALVSEAEAAAQTVMMVEIDPQEGSGVIPLDWLAFLQPKSLKGGSLQGMKGTTNPSFKNLKALAGVRQRDYSYDVFWVAFPLVDDKGVPVFSDSMREAELVVRIYNKHGTVSWPIPDSIRQRARALSQQE